MNVERVELIRNALYASRYEGCGCCAAHDCAICDADDFEGITGEHEGECGYELDRVTLLARDIDAALGDPS